MMDATPAKLSVELPLSCRSGPGADTGPPSEDCLQGSSLTATFPGGKRFFPEQQQDIEIPSVSKVSRSSGEEVAAECGDEDYYSDAFVDYIDTTKDSLPISIDEVIEFEQVKLSDLVDGIIGTSEPSEPDATAGNSTSSFKVQEEFTTPLYSGAQITLGFSLMLLMSFVIKHGLTDSAVKDLLQVISLHCPITNVCITSLFLFKKYFAGAKFLSCRYYYCSSCKSSVSQFDRYCPNSSCGHPLPLSNRSYFVDVSVEQQLHRLFEKPGFYKDLQYRFRRQKLHSDNIEDVYDGKLYQALMEHGKFLANPGNISFQWNTDGVPLFHSSNFGMWPLYLKINELPPRKRNCLTNKILAGIWLGDSKPDINTFFKPIYNALCNLYKDGITVSTPDTTEPLRCRSIMLSGTCDMPAKAVALNMIGHNGFYGCPKCCQPGKTFKTQKRGSVHVYPYISADPVGPMRTSEGVKHNAKIATQRNTVVEGIKGPISCLASLPHYDLIRGVSIDYMHCIFINIVRLLVSLWFESKYSSELWSCSRSVHTVDTCLEKIQPPNVISRTPRGISKRKFWKASEYRSWFFYYSLPVMQSILHDEYYQHYVLLVDAIYLLNSSSVSERELEKASKLLNHFYFKIPALYSERYLSCNMHQILHLPAVVMDLGPLFTTSCFDHEDSNGKLAKMVHSHSCIDSQILSSFGTLQTLSNLSQKHLQQDQEEFDIFSSITSRSKFPKHAVKINSDCYAVGAVTEAEVDAAMLHKFQSTVHLTPLHCSMFGRLILRGEMIHSQLYKRPTKRNSYTVLYEGHHKGLILYFLLVNFKCYHTVDQGSTLECVECNNQVFAVITPLLTHPDIKLANDSITGASASHIIPCYPPKDDEYVLVRACTIVEKLVYMSFCEDCVYVARIPNQFESD